MAVVAACLAGGCAYEVTYSAARSMRVRRLMSGPPWRSMRLLGFLGGTRQLLAIQVDREVQVINVRTGRSVWKTTGWGKVGKWAGRLLIEEDGRCARVFEFDSHDTARELFSLNRRRLLVAEFGAAGQFIRTDETVWRLPIGQLIGVLPKAVGPNDARAFSDDGRLIAWQDADHTVHVHDIVEERETLSRNMKGACSVVFDPQAQHLVLHVPPVPPPAGLKASEGGPLRRTPPRRQSQGRVEVVSLRTGELVWSKPMRRVNMLVTGDRRFVLRPVGLGPIIEVLRISDGECVATVKGIIKASPEGTAGILAVRPSGPNGEPYLHSIILPSGRELAKVPLPPGGTDASVSPNGNLMVSGTPDGLVVQTVREAKKLIVVRRSIWARRGQGVFQGVLIDVTGSYVAVLTRGDVLLFDLGGAYRAWHWPKRDPS